MLEVPALLFDLDRVMERVDFIAIGSNDLTQYLFAADRGLEAVARRYDPLSPPFIAVLRLIIDAAMRHDCDVSVCGEMAGRPVDAVVLAALGYRRLSMPPGALLAVKAALRSADLADVERFLVDRSDAGDPRSLTTAYLRDAGVDL